MSEWQPISTAPTDGTLISLRHEKCDGYDTVGKFHDGNWQLRSFFINGNTMSMHSIPTHWMPLPNPPKITGGE